MQLEVRRFDGKEWANYAADAHVICFNKTRPSSLNRTDFALMFVKDGEPQGYMSCHEMDAETVYMQFGGAFPSSSGTAIVFTGYTAMVRELGKTYKRATTAIENTNQAMLRLAMKAGLLIVGTRNFKGKILVEHAIEFGGING